MAALIDYSKYGPMGLDVQMKEPRILVATLNRPDKRNAVNATLHAALEDFLHVVNKDAEVRAIVLTGAGQAFCAGGDMKDMSQDPGEKGPSYILRGPKWLIQNFANCEVPIIGAINGPAAGLGASIALMCDVIYMSETARIGDTHVNMGLVAGDGGCVIWPLLVGPSRAKEYLMAGEYVEAKEAERIGLVNHVVPPDKLMESALTYARKMANGPGPAVRWTKMAINRTIWQSINNVLEFSLAVEALSVHTEDSREAVTAFREKRKPQFKGR
jgi:enoyl-CoA hydratase/carnithine racemase